MNSITGMRETNWYRIVVEGHLDEQWSEWFDGLTLEHAENGEMVMMVPFPDQSALFGLLNRLHGLNLKLVSVQRVSRYVAQRVSPNCPLG
jgi:hypothetical protein